MELCIQEMKEKEGGWFEFARWLESNSCARILWFLEAYKRSHWGANMKDIFLDTNANESFNERLKSNSKFVLSRG